MARSKMTARKGKQRPETSEAEEGRDGPAADEGDDAPPPPAKKSKKVVNGDNSEDDTETVEEEGEKNGEAKYHPVRVTVEHCTSWQVYRRKAVEYVDLLKSEYPGLESVVNQDKPRRGAFNISVSFDNNGPTYTWDGLKKGPPRKLKWPDKEELMKNLKKLMS